MGVSNPRDDRAERNRGVASVPHSTVIPRVGNAHLEQNLILDSYKILLPVPVDFDTLTPAALSDTLKEGFVIRMQHNRIPMAILVYLLLVHFKDFYTFIYCKFANIIWNWMFSTTSKVFMPKYQTKNTIKMKRWFFKYRG